MTVIPVWCDYLTNPVLPTRTCACEVQGRACFCLAAYQSCPLVLRRPGTEKERTKYGQNE